MRGRVKRWGLVANALAFLMTAAAAPRGFAQPRTAPAGASDATPAAAPALAPPKVTKFVEAKRPEGMAPDGAVVELELTIGADGTLTDAKVVGPATDELDAAALDAVRQFTFEPARKGDRTVAARIRYRYTFEPVAVVDPTKPAASAGADGGAPAGAAPVAPQPRAGRIEGKLLARGKAGADAKAIAGAAVTLLTSTGEAVTATLAAEDGTFAFPELAPGSYRLRIEAEGFASVESTEAVTAGEATDITYRLESTKDAKAAYAFGATASIDAPPREVVKRTLGREELLRTAGTRGDPLRVIELLPGVGRPPGLAGFIIIRGASPFDSQAYFENGIVDRIYHFGGLTSFVNGRLLERIDLYPGNFSARYGRKMGGIIDVGIRDPKTDGYHAVADINIIDGSILVEGPVSERGAFAFAAKRSYIDVWFKNVIPKDFVGVTAAPVYWDYQGIYTYRPKAGGRIRVMALGSADVLRLTLKQPADGDPSIRGNIGQATQFHRLQAAWKVNLSDSVEQEISAGIGHFHNDVGIGTNLGFKHRRPRCVPARRVARQAEREHQADRRLRRSGAAGRRGLRRPHRPVDRGEPRLQHRPAGRAADRALRRHLPDHSPGRLPGGAGPDRRSACCWSPACAPTTTARSRRGRSTRASPRGSSWRARPC